MKRHRRPNPVRWCIRTIVGNRSLYSYINPTLWSFELPGHAVLSRRGGFKLAAHRSQHSRETSPSPQPGKVVYSDNRRRQISLFVHKSHSVAVRTAWPRRFEQAWWFQTKPNAFTGEGVKRGHGRWEHHSSSYSEYLHSTQQYLLKRGTLKKTTAYIPKCYTNASTTLHVLLPRPSHRVGHFLLRCVGVVFWAF